jgi:alpha-galactosidase
MSDTEYKTHMSLWAMLAAPLLAGNDLRQLTSETLAILTNREVIAVNQDKLGKQGRRAWNSGDQEVWTRQLSGGDIAVAHFNRSKDEAKIIVKWTDLAVPAKRKARDLWLHQNVDLSAAEYSRTVPGHGVIMLRISKG